MTALDTAVREAGAGELVELGLGATEALETGVVGLEAVEVDAVEVLDDGVVDGFEVVEAEAFETGALETGALAVGTTTSAIVVNGEGVGVSAGVGNAAAWAPPASATIKPLEHKVTRVTAGAAARRRCAPECFEDFMPVVSTIRRRR
ncbi:MAG TPA: hypothetical protein VLR26_05330 [Frankiaceae bacterium]|nr:hypothetical protein [Frankiaceae bacterium]